jgi:cellulose synthase/poly-beta-1,6-N-acetylglucosamine synthase-like glycosyltransferase
MATFSVIIPVKPEGYVAALAALHHLDETSNQFEVLVVEGCSPSRQRNTAAQEAQGEILFFLDDDSRAAPDCLNSCASIMTDPAVAVVGGPSLTPKDDTVLQQLFGLTLSSIFGAGGMRNRYRAVGDTRNTTDTELILCNLAIRRDIFLGAEGLDERLYPNEENELLDRIQSSGNKLVHAPHMAIHRSQRKSLRLFIRQMFSYGRGRAQQTLIAGIGSIIGFVPLLFLVYLALLPFVPATASLLYIPLCLYIFLDTCFTAAAMISTGSLSAGILLFLFPLMHISNGYGLLLGLVRGKNGAAQTQANQAITVRRLKEFGQHNW